MCKESDEKPKKDAKTEIVIRIPFKKFKVLRFLIVTLLSAMLIVAGYLTITRAVMNSRLQSMDINLGGKEYVKQCEDLLGAKQIREPLSTKSEAIKKQYDSETIMWFNRALGRDCSATLVLNDSDVITHGDWSFSLFDKKYNPLESSENNQAPLAEYSDKSVVYKEYDKINQDFANSKGVAVAKEEHHNAQTNVIEAKSLSKFLAGDQYITAHYTINGIDWYLNCDIGYINNPYCVISFVDERYPQADGYYGEDADGNPAPPPGDSSSSASSATASAQSSESASSKTQSDTVSTSQSAVAPTQSATPNTSSNRG